MDNLPQCLINKLRHAMLYYKVMKQLKTYIFNTVSVVSLEFLEHGYYVFGGVRTTCVDINNINATSHETICVVNNNRDVLSDSWSRR